MGIYDREYYRGESGGSSLLGGISPVCNALIIINVAVFVFQQLFNIDESFIGEWLAASPSGIWQHGRVWQLLTATFLHGDPFHILGNMCFLWFVGREIEAMYGSRDFLAFYLIAAVFSTLVWVLFYSFPPRPVLMIGASGAVMAVVVLYALYYPHRQILLFFVLPIPMWVLVVIYLFFPFLNGGQARGGADIAIQSHLAGAAFAVAFKHFDLRWSRLLARRKFSKPRLRIFSPSLQEKPRTRSMSPSHSTATQGTASKGGTDTILPEDQLNAQLDEVLAKIAREGRGSLTEAENRVLQEASRRARMKLSDRL